MLLSAEADFEVVGEASDGDEAVNLARARQPDVVVMDVRMFGIDGVTATRMITADQEASDRLTKVLIVTTFNDDEVVYSALQAGASGFLLKHAAPRDLVSAIRRVAAGEAWIDPAIAGQVISAIATLPMPGHGSQSLLDQLTPREREVLSLMAYGLSNTQIKEQLVLSEGTVKTHVARVIMKTGSRDRAQAVALAYQSGLIHPGRRPQIDNRP